MSIYTEENLKVLGSKICNDFMVLKYKRHILQSCCPCLDSPGYLLYSPTDNNQMVYISNHTSFRGILENDKSEVHARPYKNRQDVINFLQWFYIDRKLEGLLDALQEHCSFIGDNCSPDDLSGKEVEDFLFETLIGSYTQNGLYCQKQASDGCIFYTTGCDVQGA